MKVRELTAVEQSACRAKGTQKVSQLLSDLGVNSKEDLENLSEGNFGALHEKFNAVMKNYDSCRVNFTGENYTPKDVGNVQHVGQVQRDERELVILKVGCLEAEVKAHGILSAMSAATLSRVNGTSLIFRQCAERLGVEVAPDGVTFIASDIVLERALTL
jgi:hypothetical protein